MVGQNCSTKYIFYTFTLKGTNIYNDLSKVESIPWYHLEKSGRCVDELTLYRYRNKKAF